VLKYFDIPKGNPYERQYLQQLPTIHIKQTTSTFQARSTFYVENITSMQQEKGSRAPGRKRDVLQTNYVLMIVMVSWGRGPSKNLLSLHQAINKNL
jgi:hypothetical protein